MHYSLSKIIPTIVLTSVISIAWADPAPTMPVEIINNTNIADPSQIYVLIKGTNHGDNSDCFMKLDKNGNGTCVDATENQSSSDYAVALGSLPQASDGVGYDLYLPMLDSGRMYFSIQNPISITAVKNNLGEIKIGDPDGFNNQDPNYFTLYDKIEFTYNNIALWIDPTAVDFFSMPIRIENSDSTLSSSGFYDTRTNIINSLQTTINNEDKTSNHIWNNLFVNYTNDDQSVTMLRFMAPGKAFNGSNTFDSHYLAGSPFNYMQFVQTYYQSHVLLIDCSELLPAKSNSGGAPLIYGGTVDQDGNFVFTTQNSFNSNTPAKVVIPSKDLNTFLFFSGSSDDPAFPAPNGTAAAVIVKYLTSAFASGLLPAPDAAILSKNYFVKRQASYYSPNVFLPAAAKNTGPWFDLYSQALHIAGGSDQPIYTFAYDDALGQDGTLTDPNPTALATTKITLGDMTGTEIPNPYTDNTTYNVTFQIPLVPGDPNNAAYEIVWEQSDNTKVTLQNNTQYTMTMPLHLDCVYYNNADINIYAKNSIIKPTNPSVSVPGIVITKDPNNPSNITITFPGPPQ